MLGKRWGPDAGDSSAADGGAAELDNPYIVQLIEVVGSALDAQQGWNGRGPAPVDELRDAIAIAHEFVDRYDLSALIEPIELDELVAQGSRARAAPAPGNQPSVSGTPKASQAPGTGTARAIG